MSKNQISDDQAFGREAELRQLRAIVDDMDVAKERIVALNDVIRQQDQVVENSTSELKELRHKLAFAENRLRQQNEEVEQYRSALSDVASADTVIAEWQIKYEAERAWVFELSRQRRQSEDEIARLSTNIASLEQQARLHLVRLDNNKIALANAEAANAKKLADVRAECNVIFKKIANVKSSIEEKNRLLHDQLYQQITIRHEVQAAAKASFDEVIALTKILMSQENLVNVPNQDGSSIKELFNEESSNQQLQERFREISVLSKLLMQRDAELYDKEWLNSICLYLLRLPSWWSLMPRKWRLARRARNLQKLGLFDSLEYLERYPDVADEKMDPLNHYLLHGLKEGRNRVFS